MVIEALGPAASLAYNAIGMLSSVRRTPQKDLAMRIIAQAPPGLHELPSMPSIEFTLSPEGHTVTSQVIIQGIRSRDGIPRRRKILGIMETPDGRQIALIDRRETKKGRPFRNEDGWLDFHLVLALDVSRWKKDRTLAPALNDPAATQKLLLQCRWIHAGTHWQTGWRRYSADHHRHGGNQKANREMESGWALTRNGVLLINPGTEGRGKYPAHVILETGDGLYLPVVRIMEDTLAATLPAGPSPRFGERTITWQGNETPDWEDAVRQLYRHHGWRAEPDCRRSPDPSEHFQSPRDSRRTNL